MDFQYPSDKTIQVNAFPKINEKRMGSLVQVYCGNESGINEWLRENRDVDIVDFKMSVGDKGERIMVIYKK